MCGNRLLKKEKSSADKVIKDSINLFGFTPAERSDENQNWMLENGYFNKKPQKRRSGIRGRRPRQEIL
jgi:hypothetical protein